MPSYLLNKKVIFVFVLLGILATAWYVFSNRGTTIVEQQKIITKLEDNITFSNLDYAAEVENAVTTANSSKRNEETDEAVEEIKKMVKEIDNEKDANGTKFDNTVFDRMYLYQN